MAVERMKACGNISALAQELGIPRVLLYRWSKAEGPEGLPEAWQSERWQGKDQEKAKLTEHLRQVKQLLADKTVEVDFLRGALQRIEARRQERESSGGTQSTSKSSK